MTKWVLGAASMMFWMISGMLSRGGRGSATAFAAASATSISNRPNCGMVPQRSPRKMPMLVMAKRSERRAVRNSGIEPWIGTASNPCTMNTQRNAGGHKHHQAHRPDLAGHDFEGVTGITSRCSMVPCSRSRISAAPVRMIDSIVIDEITFLMAPNQVLLSSGLKRARRASSTGRGRPSAVGAEIR